MSCHVMIRHPPGPVAASAGRSAHPRRLAAQGFGRLRRDGAPPLQPRAGQAARVAAPPKALHVVARQKGFLGLAAGRSGPGRRSAAPQTRRNERLESGGSRRPPYRRRRQLAARLTSSLPLSLSAWGEKLPAGDEQGTTAGSLHAWTTNGIRWGPVKPRQAASAGGRLGQDGGQGQGNMQEVKAVAGAGIKAHEITGAAKLSCVAQAGTAGAGGADVLPQRMGRGRGGLLAGCG